MAAELLVDLDAHGWQPVTADAALMARGVQQYLDHTTLHGPFRVAPVEQTQFFSLSNIHYLRFFAQNPEKILQIRYDDRTKFRAVKYQPPCATAANLAPPCLCFRAPRIRKLLAVSSETR